MKELVRGRLTCMGDIYLVDSPDALGRDDTPVLYPKAMVIEFDSVEDIRKAVASGVVAFGKFGEAE